MLDGRFAALVVPLVLVGSLGAAPLIAQTRPAGAPTAPALAAVPTSDDVLRLLEQERPDDRLLAERRAAADRRIPANLSGNALAEALLTRAQARSNLGRTTDAIADYRAILRTGVGGAARIQGHLGLSAQLFFESRFRESRTQAETVVRIANVEGQRGWMLPALRFVTLASIGLGDVRAPKPPPAGRRG